MKGKREHEKDESNDPTSEEQFGPQVLVAISADIPTGSRITVHLIGWFQLLCNSMIHLFPFNANLTELLGAVAVIDSS